MSAYAAYALCGRLASVGMLLSALEGLTTVGEYRANGVFDPRYALPTTVAFRPGLMALAVSVRTIGAIYVLRVAAGLTLLLAPWEIGIAAAAWTTVAGTALFLEWRRPFGDDGGDQMLTIMSIAFAAALVLSFARHSLALALYFVGAQGCLAYAVAGIAKLRGEEWRSGTATRRIFSTRTYGSPRIARLLQKWHLLARMLCWGTIAFEVSFVAAPLLPFPALIVLLAIAASFHLGSAVIMGLNGFL
jgi:hypothetical protein